MARVGRSLVGVAVVLAAAGALVAALVGVVAYSGGRLYHDLASAKEQPTPNLVTNARVPSVIYGANGSVIATLRSSLYRQPVKLARISRSSSMPFSTPRTIAFGFTGAWMWRRL